MLPTWTALGLALALAAFGCAPQEAAPKTAAERQDRSQKLIVSGNEAYRIGDYRLAARRYAAAAVVDADDPAAYYGMGMALSKLGRDEEARTAYAKARSLARTNPVLQSRGLRTSNAPAETIGVK